MSNLHTICIADTPHNRNYSNYFYFIELQHFRDVQSVSVQSVHVYIFTVPFIILAHVYCGWIVYFRSNLWSVCLCLYLCTRARVCFPYTCTQTQAHFTKTMIFAFRHKKTVYRKSAMQITYNFSNSCSFIRLIWFRPQCARTHTYICR